MSEKKPIPLQINGSRGICPVCGKASYSQSGTHPQCGLARADAVFRATRKAEGPQIKPSPPRKPWTKMCPKCQHNLPIRTDACSCGHKFGAAPAGITVNASQKVQGTNGRAQSR